MYKGSKRFTFDIWLKDKEIRPLRHKRELLDHKLTLHVATVKEQ